MYKAKWKSDDKLRYILMKKSSFSPFYYTYMMEYEYTLDFTANVVYTVFAIIAVCMIIGLVRGNIVMDTLVWSLALGSFLCNCRMFRVLDKGHKTGYFRESTGCVLQYDYGNGSDHGIFKDAVRMHSWKEFEQYVEKQYVEKYGFKPPTRQQCTQELFEQYIKERVKKHGFDMKRTFELFRYRKALEENGGYWFNSLDDLALYPMIALSQFFEIYTPFLLAVVVPGVVFKIIAGLLFIGLLIFYKASNNFMEWTASQVIGYNSLYPVIAFVLGIVLSVQPLIKVSAFDNPCIVGVGIAIGVLRYALDRKYRDFFAQQKAASRDKTSPIGVHMLERTMNNWSGWGRMFNDSEAYLAMKDEWEKWAEKCERKWETKEEREKRLEEEKKRKEEEEKKREKERRERSMKLARERAKQDERDKKLLEEWRENARKEKERKKLEEKILRGDVDKLTEEEKIRKKELVSKQSEVKVPDHMQNDRASIRR